MTETELPPLYKFHGNWDAYVNEIYKIYLDEIVDAGHTFQGLPIRHKFIPKTDNKGYGFWHLISEGRVEEDRIIDIQRCERIRWIAWIIEYAETSHRISWWENRRKSSKNVVLWAENEEFAVILSKRSGYYLLTTAYVVKPNRKRSFAKERDNYHGLKG